MKQTWSRDAIDAVSILVPECRFNIEGTPGDQIVLEGGYDESQERDLIVEPAERWLRIRQYRRAHSSQFTLRLPQRKAWVIELSAGWGEVTVARVRARVRVQLGKGQVQVEHSEGSFDLMVGQGDVEMDHCIEAVVPEPPPQPTTAAPGTTSSDEWAKSGTQTRPPRPPRPPRPSRAPGDWSWDWSWDWVAWDEQAWSDWGLQLAEQAASWAGRISRFFTQPDWKPGDAGIHLRTGKGDAKLEYVETRSCGIWIGKGNVTMEHGCIADLKAYAGHGDVKCESILPEGAWAVKTGHGNIRLSLPADTQAKFDVATRHGDIRSEIPLVRVGRPGPESRYGGRMVGNVGNADSARESRPGSKPAEIDLATMNGDIRIGLQRFDSPYTTATTASASTSDEVNRVEDASERPNDDIAETTERAYDSPLNVLQALSQREITVEEAERLLRKLQS